VHAAIASDEDRPEDTPARGSISETVLVVEDDADVRAYSSETLRELGYDVIESENGKAGLRALQANPAIRVLFTDIGLPGGMNGRQLSEEARKLRPDLKVLFTTGYARNAIVHEGRLDPGVELITKPFTQSALAEKVRDIIDAGQFPGRVLLVEDEPLIQMLAVEYLEEAGFKVDTAGSAAEAMNKLALMPGGFDAVVLDVGLPDRSGDTLFHEIRAVHASLPIVLATGQGAAELRRAFQGQAKVGIAAKPYNARDLIGALRALGVHTPSAAMGHR